MYRARRSSALGLALVAVAAVLGTVRGAVGPNVLLITLDTTRADRMGFLGSARGLTPALDALARTSAVFTRAYTQSPITTVSHATILTGAYPPAHHVNDFGAPLPAAVPYLPDLFRQHGYKTAAFVGSLILDPRAGTAPGFDRGFDVYDAGFRLRQPGEDRYQTLERRGDEVAVRALRWLVAAPSPFFLWVHLYDPHDPYDPPADLKRRFASEPYDGEIGSVDRIVHRILAGLPAGAERNTCIVIAADHGEALGDHGESTHGVFLYEATMHVPLLVRLPERRSGGARVEGRVRLVDVAPTVLEVAGLPVPAVMQGESLVPLLDAGAGSGRRGATAGGQSGGARGGGAVTAERPVYSETEYPRRAFGWSPLASWRAERFLFSKAPRRELYDLEVDPAQTKNLADTRARVADGMDAELEQFLRRAGAGPDRVATAAAGRAGRDSTTETKPPIDPAVAERLAALGYVSGSDNRPRPSGVDPKDRIAVANTLHEAVLAVEDGQFQKAVPLLERVVASEPDIPIAQLNLGVARARLHQYAQAIAPLSKAIALQPDVMIAQYELGLALYQTGDLETAASHFEVVASRMPKWADARYSLGSVYARINRVQDALGELRAAIDLDPRHFRANLLLGRILTLQGNATGAIPHLQTAIDVQPASGEAHQFLADAYENAGRPADAAKERRRAEELKGKH
jgi:choline-sulfatase